MPDNQDIVDRDRTHSDGERAEVAHYRGPAGGWGSLRGIASVFGEEWPTPGALETLLRQNKPNGFMCVSCSWAKPADYHTFEFCENGAKATLWELTTPPLHPGFLRQAYPHRTARLERLRPRTAGPPDRIRCATTRRPTTTFPANGMKPSPRSGPSSRRSIPKSVIFYSSGRASLETSYLYALFARLYGNNNLPDSSNMCHETTSVALKKVDRRRRRHRRLR